MEHGFIPFIVVVAVGLVIFSNMFRYFTVFEWQRGLLYRKGKFIRLLLPGRYRCLKSRSTVICMDVRRASVTIPGQDILTKDNINIKISLSGVYEITDPVAAKHRSENFLNEFYGCAQIALRQAVADMELETLLEKQGGLGQELREAIAERAKDLGIMLYDLSLRDILLPANLKKAFAGIMEAKKDAQRQLEKARGEQAVLRSLANSSALYENNRNLLQARVIQALTTGNHTIVFNADDPGIAAAQKPVDASRK